MEPARSEGREVTTARTDATLVSRACEVADSSFRAFLDARDTPRIHWATPDGFEVVGGEAAVEIAATGEERFDALRGAAREVFDDADYDGPAVARPRMFGGLSFLADHAPAAPWTGFPASSFVLPRVALTRGDGRTYLTVSEYGDRVDASAVEDRLETLRDDVSALPKMVPSGAPAGVADVGRTTSRAEWTTQVRRAVERIESGDLRKVVLAQALEATLEQPVAIPDVLERLRGTYPNCYRFLVEPTAAAGFFGAPPERLVRVDGRRVETEALAGSKPRGETLEADADHAASLLESEKLQHEQGVVTDAIRTQLAPFGDVRVGEQGIQRLATIQHLRTPIEATLETDEHVLTLVEALHPTPAVGGLPPDRAQEFIRETETFDRGWYAAPVGWFDGDGDGEFAVGLRSGVATDGAVTLFAGNGIVADSDPDEEWEEVQLKFRPILDELE